MLCVVLVSTIQQHEQVYINPLLLGPPPSPPAGGHRSWAESPAFLSNFPLAVPLPPLLHKVLKISAHVLPVSFSLHATLLSALRSGGLLAFVLPCLTEFGDLWQERMRGKSGIARMLWREP